MQLSIAWYCQQQKYNNGETWEHGTHHIPHCVTMGELQGLSVSILNIHSLVQDCGNSSANGLGHETVAVLLPGFAINW